MRVLEKLRLEVERLNHQAELQKSRLAAQELFYERQLLTGMRAASDYFYEFTEKLNVIKPDIYASYPLDPDHKNGLLLKQADYLCRTDSRNKPRQIDILCSCSLDNQHQFFVPTKMGAAKHAELLDAYNFLYQRKNKLDSLYDICGATFILEGPMRVHIRILAMPEDKCIEVVIRNVDSDPVPKRYKFTGENFDDQLLDRLGKLLVREVPLLVELKLTDEAREKLRGQLAHEKLLEEQHWATVDAGIEDEQAATRNSKNVRFSFQQRLNALGQAGKALKVFRKA